MTNKKDNRCLVIDDSNMDEFYYKYLGQTHRGLLWKLFIRTKWFIKSIPDKLPARKRKVRNFLHLDIQRLRWGVSQYTSTRRELRYFDEHGKLFKQTFEVYVTGSYLEIREVPRKYPKEAKTTKGPMTVRPATRCGSNLSWFGLKRYRHWDLRLEKTY